MVCSSVISEVILSCGIFSMDMKMVYCFLRSGLKSSR